MINTLGSFSKIMTFWLLQDNRVFPSFEYEAKNVSIIIKLFYNSEIKVEKAYIELFFLQNIEKPCIKA